MFKLPSLLVQILPPHLEVLGSQSESAVFLTFPLPTKMDGSCYCHHILLLKYLLYMYKVHSIFKMSNDS